MREDVGGWRPDPFGAHELRLFSPEGRPTQHVSDGGRNSFEKLPQGIRATPAAGGSGGAAEDDHFGALAVHP
jgi:hypothetical protein